jgi:hypothetical protein
MQPLRGWLGSAPAAAATRARVGVAGPALALRSPDPRLSGQGNSTRRERHSGDQGFPRSTPHQSPPRPQLPPSRKGQFEWDAEYVKVRWALTRRPCVASPGAIAFAGGEAPRRYYSRASGAALRLLPTRASMGTVLIQPTEIRRHRGEWPPTRPRRAGPIGRSGRPPVGVQASVGVFLVAVARYGARIKSVDLVICCPSRNSISRFAAGMARAYAASPWRPAQLGAVDLRKGHLRLAARFAQMGDRSGAFGPGRQTFAR